MFFELVDNHGPLSPFGMLLKVMTEKCKCKVLAGNIGDNLLNYFENVGCTCITVKAICEKSNFYNISKNSGVYASYLGKKQLQQQNIKVIKDICRIRTQNSSIILNNHICLSIAKVYIYYLLVTI